MAGTVWDDVLARVETKVNRYSYYQWFQHTALIDDLGHTLVVRVADPMVVDWLTKHYAVIIEDALGEVGRAGVSLQFRPEGSPADMTGIAAGTPVAPAEPEPVPGEFDGDGTDGDEPIGPGGGLAGLSPRYSFDTFIVGASNQFAHAACRAVAEAPSRSYNPLFLYGGVGLGKTHLMHAIGHYVL